MKKYKRASFDVVAEKYETGKGMEDGFQLLTKIVTNGWINTDNLVKIQTEDGNIVCPFISNKRGLIFINEGDYIIVEGDDDRHICSGESFSSRFIPYE
jgi:translation initiation factor IF-1